MDVWTCTEVDNGQFVTGYPITWYSDGLMSSPARTMQRTEFRIQGVIKRFTIPKFDGTPLYITMPCNVGSYVNGTVYCILCSSSDEASKYASPTENPYEVADESRLDIKEVPIAANSNGSSTNYHFTVYPKPKEITQNTEYFLLFFPKTILGTNSVGINQTMTIFGTPSILLYTSKGLVRISTDTGVSTYQAYIDDGSTQSLYTPHIDTGTSWEICT